MRWWRRRAVGPADASRRSLVAVATAAPVLATMVVARTLRAVRISRWRIALRAAPAVMCCATHDAAPGSPVTLLALR